MVGDPGGHIHRAQGVGLAAARRLGVHQEGAEIHPFLLEQAAARSQGQGPERALLGLAGQVGPDDLGGLDGQVALEGQDDLEGLAAPYHGQGQEQACPEVPWADSGSYP